MRGRGQSYREGPTNPGNGGCTDCWLRAAGTGAGVVCGPLGAGPGEREGRGPVPACSLVGGLWPMGGAVGLAVLRPPAVRWDRACARGGGGRVCTARMPS